ncbi:hypothetical protein TNCV_194321 [Trichonephila clavipes]|nr:hypothetical protein TNCV_194321 [Trichonephila clavipes]
MLDRLEDNIRRVIADIRPQMLEKVIENWTSRLDYIRANPGKGSRKQLAILAEMSGQINSIERLKGVVIASEYEAAEGFKAGGKNLVKHSKQKTALVCSEKIFLQLLSKHSRVCMHKQLVIRPFLGRQCILKGAG